jgi:protein phosphatase
LCSDGLSGQLSDHWIGAVAGALPPAEACRFLVNLANLRGGPDNITVVIVRVNGSIEEPEPPPASKLNPPRPWYRRIPWALTALFLGILFAAEAVLLTAFKVNSALYALILAAVALLSGLAGLGFYYWQERRHSRQLSGDRNVNVYRQSPCPVERTFLDKLSTVEEGLRHLVTEKNWDVDWDAYHRHHQHSKALLNREDLVGAFREACRAVRPLTEAVQKNRFKEESFQPLWDKA